MHDLSTIDVVVAAPGKDGKGTFIEISPPARHVVPGAVEAVFFWGSPDIPALPHKIGEVPADVGFPLPGGTKFGLICFPANSAGKLDVSRGYDVTADVDPSDRGMHRSDTIDYEVIISGKVDIVLDSGEVRTLGPGSCLVMGGVMHAWRNHYDQPCIYAAITVGATPPA